MGGAARSRHGRGGAAHRRGRLGGVAADRPAALLRQSRGVAIKAINWPHLCVLAFNHLHPPFNNQKLRQALLPAIDQRSFIQAIVGEQMDLARIPAGFYTEGTPMANHTGLEILTGKRDLALARKLVSESGYQGEPILKASPS